MVSDTHGHAGHTLDAVRMLDTLEVDLVVHCGDVGSAQIPALLGRWTAHFVLGNVDRDAQALGAAIAEAGALCHGQFGQIECEGRTIAFLHGHDERRLRETIECGEWDLVCHGHTHVKRLARHGRTIILNPGALYRANPHSIAIVDLPELAVTHVTL